MQSQSPMLRPPCSPPNCRALRKGSVIAVPQSTVTRDEAFYCKNEGVCKPTFHPSAGRPHSSYHFAARLDSFFPFPLGTLQADAPRTQEPLIQFRYYVPCYPAKRILPASQPRRAWLYSHLTRGMFARNRGDHLIKRRCLLGGSNFRSRETYSENHGGDQGAGTLHRAR